MPAKLRIYTLKGLTPEIRAVTFAKCSRSPEPFDEIARELTEEKSAEFHEKWVVGYGHSSVAEHAVLSIAFENVSILATKVIEDNRLASYTEKSTRYQVFNRDKYHHPKKIMDSKFAKLYQETGDFLFDTYESLFPKVLEFIKKKYPREEKQTKKLYEMVSKARACDIVRLILPTATQTNLGMTVNARSLEYAIVKLLSHPLEEINEIGREVKRVSLEETPTLIKFADRNNFIIKTKEALAKEAKDFLSQESLEPVALVKLVSYDKDAENKLVASLIYKHSKYPYEQILKKVLSFSFDEKLRIINESLKYRTDHDRPLRELEHVYYTFDILMDYGAFRDIQRHRICTQTNQEVTTEHGYVLPQSIEDLNLKKEYTECMNRAHEAYCKIFQEFPNEAQYIVPLAYKKRVLITWNLRELFHFIPLRSSKKGHISYRLVAQQVWRELNLVHPALAKYIDVDMEMEGVSWAASLENKEFVYNPYAARKSQES